MSKFKIVFRISPDGKRVTKEVTDGCQNVELKMTPGTPENGWLFTVEGETLPTRIHLPH